MLYSNLYELIKLRPITILRETEVAFENIYFSRTYVRTYVVSQDILQHFVYCSSLCKICFCCCGVVCMDIIRKVDN